MEELEAKERLGQRLQSQVEGPCESTKATEYQAGQSKGTIPTYLPVGTYLPTYGIYRYPYNYKIKCV